MCQDLYRRLVNSIANEVVPISLNGYEESEGDILILSININFFFYQQC